jgi:hypothetical protein
MEFSQDIGFLFGSVLKVGEFVKTSVHIEKSLLNLLGTLLGDVDRKQRQKQFLKKGVMFFVIANGNSYTRHFYLEDEQKINQNTFMRSILCGLSNHMRNSRNKVIPRK